MGNADASSVCVLVSAHHSGFNSSGASVNRASRPQTVEREPSKLVYPSRISAPSGCCKECPLSAKASNQDSSPEFAATPRPPPLKSSAHLRPPERLPATRGTFLVGVVGLSVCAVSAFVSPQPAERRLSLCRSVPVRSHETLHYDLPLLCTRAADHPEDVAGCVLSAHLKNPVDRI